MFKYLALLIFVTTYSSQLYSACGGTLREWDGDRTTWSDRRGWTGNNVPNTVSEDAKVVSAAKNCELNTSVTIGCFENDAGVMTHANDNTLTVVGDYFRSLTPNSYSVNENDYGYIKLAGTGPQTFEMVDPVNDLLISNDTTVTFTESFEVRWQITFEGSSTHLIINKNLKITYDWADFTIPAGITVELATGASFNVAGNLIVNGNLRMNPGSSVILGNGKTLTVGTTGEIRMEGALGNVATIKGLTDYINMDMNGYLYADYFRFERIGADGKGVNIDGSITKMDHGDFLYINSNAYGMTLGASASLPSLMDGVSFFDNNSYGNNKNINATSYSGGIVTIDNYSGIGGEAYETDPNNKIDWTTPAPTVILLSTNNNIGSPSDPVNAGDPAQEFTIFSFSLNQADTSTDITSVTFSLDGTASAYDVDYIRVYNQGATCQSVGTQIGGDYTLSGEPGSVTVAIPPGDLSISDTNSKCLHVYLKTTDSATHNASIGVGILGTEDVSNSQAYSFSASSGPPVIGPTVIIEGDPVHSWTGRRNDRWNGDNRNWSNNIIPDTSMNCKIAVGERTLKLNGSYGCQNMTFASDGILNWNSGSYILSVTGILVIGSNVDFQNATAANFTLNGSSNQGVTAQTAIPNDLVINNSGGATSIITLQSSMTINGDLTISSGTVRIPNGVTVTVLGNVSVASGAILDIQGGGTLALNNGSSVSINNGATLQMIGSSSSARMTSNGITNTYAVNINGIIKAQNYAFDHLDSNGLVINSGATIDSTYHLQDGSFSYPVSNGSTLLKLYKAIPDNALSGMNFSLGGSSATGVVNIYTDSSIGAGTLTISNYSGDVSGASFDNDNTYLLAWSGLLNTINISADASSAASLYQGQTYNMGRFAFVQDLASASYVDTDITTFVLTLIGTGSANDIDQVRLYYDSDCDGTNGTEVGTATIFSGNPARATFSSMIGTTIPADVSSPATVCLYVEFDIASDAINGQTIGVELNRSDHFITADSYEVSGSTILPLSLGAGTVIGSSTIWTGAVDTNWFNAGNWNSGIPTSSLNCFINASSNNPIISSGTAVCNSIEIGGGGNLTINSGATLQLHGALENLGVFTVNGTLELTDDGVTQKNQIITGITGVSTLLVSKSAGGTVALGDSTFSAETLTLTGANYTFFVGYEKTLSVSSSLNVNAGTFILETRGNIAMGNGASLNIGGGTFSIVGTHDMYPQNVDLKGRIYATSGTWSFNATSGSVSLKGFLFDGLDENGVVIGGTTDLTYLGGGQLRNLSNNYTTVKGFQINTTGSIVTTASDIGWNWSPDNTFPQASDSYNLITSSGCAGQSIEFVEFFGDWFDTVDVNPEDKVTLSNCNVTFGNTQSAVALRSFTATPYNGAVDLRWSTTNETDHFGFNVYRSQADGKNFIQLNEMLIMNLLNSSTMQGNYQFLDLTAQNDVTYYYYIEDVEINGTVKQHGPVIATPLDGLGNDYSDINDTNSGSRSSGVATTPSPSVIENSGYIDLGDGVTILSKTSSTIKLQITPGTLNFTESPLDNNYKQVAIDGYQRMTVAGAPELLEKTLLIEVDSDITTAQLLHDDINDSFAMEQQIVPAAHWISDGADGLQASFVRDSSIYDADEYYNPLYYQLLPEIITVGPKRFLKVIVSPLAYNPVQNKIKRADKIVLEIGLNGRDWDMEVPTEQMVPYNASNALKLFIQQTGYYSIRYDDLVDSFVESPFIGASTDSLRLYYLGAEIPIKVISGDEIFNSGDTIEFFVKYTSPKDDVKRVVVLSTEDLLLSGSAPINFEELDGDPSLGDFSPQRSFNKSVILEENNLELMDAPLGMTEDHFYWTKLLKNSANNGSSTPDLSTTVTLDHIDFDSLEDVQVRIYIKGTHGYNINLTHRLGLYLRGESDPIANEIFTDDNPRVITFNLPVDELTNGVNSLSVGPMGTEVPVSDYDVIYINKIEIIYPSLKFAQDNELNFRNFYADTVQNIDGFSSNQIKVLDISSRETKVIINPQVSTTSYTDGDGNPQQRYDVSFTTNSDNSLATEYFVVEQSAYKKPVAMELNYGFRNSLHGSDNRADYLIIGHRDLLNVAGELLTLRESQGLEVKAVYVQQIYNEFSDAEISSYAIRDFIDYALNYWSVKPKYILLLGDGNYDPQNILQYGYNPRNIPTPLIRGLLYDVGSDNWFVSSDDSALPRASIGRLPTSDPEVLFNYIQKMIRYEKGESAPSVENKKELVFISDYSEPSYNENFDQRVQLLSGISSIAQNDFTSSFITRIDQGGGVFNDDQVHEQIVEAFNGNNFMVTYYGHGAEDMWSDSDLLPLSEINAMTNAKLPIVLSLNCLNTAYFYPDSEYVTIGETMIFNPNGGAVAFVGSGSMTMPEAQMNFATNLYQEVGDGSVQSTELRLGDFVMKAKISAGDSQYQLDVNNSYTILGDPAMSLPQGFFTQSSSSADSAGQTLTLGGGGCAVFASEKSSPTTGEGILEYLFLISLTYIIRRLQKRFEF